jgi:hypothetical protein
MVVRIFLTFVICISPLLLYAQSRSVIQLRETGLWNGFYFKIKFSEKLGYYGEHHYRLRNSENNLYNFIGQKRQIYNRAGLNILFNPHFEAVIGPTLVLNFTPRPGDPNFEKVTWEPRIWHQWLFIMPSMGRTKVFHQFRFEHRWRRSNEIGSAYQYTNRYRYKLFAYIPINKKKIEEKSIFFSPSAEIFMHSGKSVVMNPFEDFRTYNGFGYVLNRQVTFFAGHMWTFGQRSSGFEYAMSHIIRLNILVSFDARRIENRLPPINLGY